MGDTLCWECARACGLCPWSEYKRQRPVPGWTAARKDVASSMSVDGRMVSYRVESYRVSACPLYVPDARESDAGKRDHRRWAKAEVARLEKLRCRGLTQKEIAAQLDRTEASVKKKMKAMRLAKREADDG